MEPFIGQVIMFAGNFAPRDWAFCDGQLLSISANTALFSILGTTYGGDGRQTFGLPDLRGRAPVHVNSNGAGGLDVVQLGQKFGVNHVSLTVDQIPSHNHTANVSGAPADNDRPGGDLIGRSTIFNTDTAPPVALSAKTIGATGGSQQHDNNQPSLGINYIIALQGIFPSRS